MTTGQKHMLPCLNQQAGWTLVDFVHRMLYITVLGKVGWDLDVKLFDELAFRFSG